MMAIVARRDAVNAAEAVGALFDQHQSGLCRLATVLLGDAGRAEEVVQDAFLRVYRSWWRIRDQDRAQAYLRATVVNLCRSQLRRRTVEDRVNRATWTAEDRQAAGAPVPGSFGIPDDSGAVLALHRALQTLPTRQREVVVLYYFEDLSVTAIAGIVGCAGGTVKSQLAKARRHLQQAMEGSSGEVPDA